jgi:hypothetical protein
MANPILAITAIGRSTVLRSADSRNRRTSSVLRFEAQILRSGGHDHEVTALVEPHIALRFASVSPHLSLPGGGGSRDATPVRRAKGCRRRP